LKRDLCGETVRLKTLLPLKSWMMLKKCEKMVETTDVLVGGFNPFEKY